MSCLSDRKPNLPFVINLFCASYNLATLDNGITLKVTDTQHEVNTHCSSASCLASVLLPPLFATPLDFIDSLLLFLQPISAAFWMLPVQTVLLYDSADQYPTLSRVISSRLLCTGFPLAFQFIPTRSKNLGALFFLC